MRLAFGMGAFLPLAETVRRFHQLTDLGELWSWFDDYVLGGCLLLAAYAVRVGWENATTWLVAAWGAGSGALFLSLLGQIRYVRSPTGDPGIFSAGFVLAAKALILATMLLGLWTGVRANAAERSR